VAGRERECAVAEEDGEAAALDAVDRAGLLIDDGRVGAGVARDDGESAGADDGDEGEQLLERDHLSPFSLAGNSGTGCRTNFVLQRGFPPEHVYILT
jgi:hypothetical protein